jgi:hypothetical protein
LRGALLVVWIAFLPAWLLALNRGVQPTALRVGLSFVFWVGAWQAGHVVLRRERCPVCGGRLFSGEAFESLRATRCANCEREFGAVGSGVRTSARNDDGPTEPDA